MIVSRAALAAPLLALVLALGSCQDAPPPAARIAPPAPPELIAPKGRTPWPFTFTWKPVAGADWIYRVQVIDNAERILMDAETRSASLPAPPILKGMLGGHVAFDWVVVVQGPDGKEAARSAPARFRLE